MISAVEKYKKKLARCLKCFKITKKRLIGGLKPTFEAFLQDAPDADYPALCAAFGPPEEMAKQLMQEVTLEERKQHKKHWIITAVIIGVLASLFVGFTVYVYAVQATPTYFEYNTVVFETVIVTQDATEETVDSTTDATEETIDDSAIESTEDSAD